MIKLPETKIIGWREIEYGYSDKIPSRNYKKGDKEKFKLGEWCFIDLFIKYRSGAEYAIEDIEYGLCKNNMPLFLVEKAISENFYDEKGDCFSVFKNDFLFRYFFTTNKLLIKRNKYASIIEKSIEFDTVDEVEDYADYILQEIDLGQCFQKTSDTSFKVNLEIGYKVSFNKADRHQVMFDTLTYLVDNYTLENFSHEVEVVHCESMLV